MVKDTTISPHCTTFLHFFSFFFKNLTWRFAGTVLTDGAGGVVGRRFLGHFVRIFLPFRDYLSIIFRFITHFMSFFSVIGKEVLFLHYFRSYEIKPHGGKDHRYRQDSGRQDGKESPSGAPLSRGMAQAAGTRRPGQPVP